jgi:PIN domain nuclease of toxin-antitoxin system
MGNESLILLDTHALVWWATEPRKLSQRARKAAQAAATDGKLAASAMSLFEISTLLRRGRLSFSIQPDRWFIALTSLPELIIEPISPEIAWDAGNWESTFPGDPADRIIAATARTLDARLITADEQLRAALGESAVW